MLVGQHDLSGGARELVVWAEEVKSRTLYDGFITGERILDLGILCFAELQRLALHATADTWNVGRDAWAVDNRDLGRRIEHELFVRLQEGDARHAVN